ncbi:glucan endo-1,3-beta-glucosidase A1 [Folsomia candida]|uniref:glucan endo-1,3-beta-glucosidase A1 n=1 Tax=Folsomia candida TaxID=158441 RepID=UPI000B9070A4|nr:glucan endo-1,3-beta-glucosidase A1 [Folsomia candida]
MVSQLYVILGLFFYATLASCCRKGRSWEGNLFFHDDFDGFDVKRDHWTYEEFCHGKGQGDTNLECFSDSDENVRVWNGTLILTTLYKPLSEKRLFSRQKNFTSARLTTTGRGFTYGTFVVSARLPKGKSLFPSIWLVPAYKDHDNCKYEEIEIVQGRGEKTSNLIFSASFGKHWNSVVTKRVEKAFPGIDFSESFHEVAFSWKPKRMEWYVDGISVFTASTHFYSDWILSDETNVPCSRDKSLFKQPFQLTMSMSVGGAAELLHSQDTPLTPDEAMRWEKPIFEIDWVKVYQQV